MSKNHNYDFYVLNYVAYNFFSFSNSLPILNIVTYGSNMVFHALMFARSRGTWYLSRDLTNVNVLENNV